MNVEFGVDPELLIRWMGRHAERRNLPLDDFSSIVDLVSKDGVTVTEDGRALFAACIYPTPTSGCYIGWMASDPDNTLEESAESAAMAVRGCLDWAKAHGFKHVITLSGNSGINRLFERNGGVEADKNVKQYCFFAG